MARPGAATAGRASDMVMQSLHLGPQPEPTLTDNISKATTLSWETRVYCFVGCYILGTLLSIGGSIMLMVPVTGIILFAVFFSLGNVVQLASTCLLKGPLKQIKEMFASSRWIATVIMLVFLVLTLVVALWKRFVLLTVVFCCCQSLAMTWYSLSYIPYARTVVKGIFTSTVESH